MCGRLYRQNRASGGTVRHVVSDGKEQIRCPKEPGANVGLPFLAQNWVVACEAQPDRSHLAGRFVTSLSLWAGLILAPLTLRRVSRPVIKQSVLWKELLIIC
jgi:hypothetical protein